jgi:hypothetical protein
VWNQSYEQGWWNAGQAQASVQAHPEYYNYDNVNNSYIWAVRRAADEEIHVGDLFAQVYGPDAMMTTVRPVLASQVAWPYILRQQLDFVEHFYGDPAAHFYAVAGAPYINLGNLSNDPNLTVDEVIQGLHDDIANLHHTLAAYDSMAAYYGMKTLLYEGGIDLSGDTNGNFASAKVPANYDPRIAQVVKDYLQGVYADGAEQLMWMNDASAYDVSGTWGLTEDISKLDNPKYAGVLDFVNSAQPALTIGNLLPASNVGGALTIDAGQYTADEWETPGTGTVLSDLEAGKTLDYLLRVPRSAPYTLTVRAGSDGGGKLQVIVEDQAVATFDIPEPAGAGGGMQDLPALQLGPGDLPRSLLTGLHTVRLKVLEGTLSLESLTFGVKANFGPTGVVARSASGGGIDVSWENVPGATGFYVERSADGVTGWTPVGSTLAPGDANTDGAMDFADFVTVSNHYGQFGGWSEGDFNGDQRVNFADFVALSNHYGQHFDGTSAAGLTVHDGGVAPGETWYYHVRAAFGGGTSGGESAVVAAVVGGAAPEIVVAAPASTSAMMTSTVAPSSVGASTGDGEKVVAKNDAEKTAGHGMKVKKAASRNAVQAEQRVAAVRAAQWWWAWWRSFASASLLRR